MSSEADTRANFIDPALKAAHWQPSNIIREHYFTDGRKMAGGARGRRCFVDYLLRKDNRYLAVVEAKKDSEHPTKGLQQAIDYAEKLCVRFVYSDVVKLLCTPQLSNFSQFGHLGFILIWAHIVQV
nr:hypothetical protein [Nitrincola tibetensis]